MRILLTLLISGFVFSLGYAQSATEGQAKGALVYHFCENINWAEKESEELFKIAYLSDEDAFYDALQELSLTKKIKNKSVRITRIDAINSISDEHVVILGDDKRNLVDVFYDQWEAKEILLVTDGYADLKKVMVNLYRSDDKSISFQVNKANIFIQGLSVLPELIIYGGSEIDIADIYKKAKQDLESALKELEFEKRILALQQQELQKLKYDYETQSDSLLAQKRVLSAQHEIIIDQQEQIEDQKKSLALLNSRLAEKQALIKRTADSLAYTLQSIRDKESQLEILRAQKDGFDQQIKKQKKVIGKQEEIITDQKEVINTDKSTISEQKFYLLLQVGVILLSLGIIFLVYRGYVNKKRSEALLTEQKKKVEDTLFELQEAQSQLIQTEKMATLGQLTAGVAHEINTPLGAILSSAENMGVILDELTYSLPNVIKELRSKELMLFQYLISNKSDASDLSTRERRAERKRITEKLNDENIPQSTELAEFLVELCDSEAIQYILPVLKHEDRLKITESAFTIAMLYKNGRNIRQAVEKATKVLFALKKYTRKGGELTKGPVDLKDNIDTVLMIYKNNLRDIELIKNYQFEGDGLMGFPEELSQVWTNLIQNASHAMNNKGNLEIETKQENDYVLVTIKDDGPGIPDDIKDKVFAPFFTTKGLGEGTGLGLDIVKRIIDKHGGQIRFESKENEGTVFYVYLPLS